MFGGARLIGFGNQDAPGVKLTHFEVSKQGNCREEGRNAEAQVNRGKNMRKTGEENTIGGAETLC